MGRFLDLVEANKQRGEERRQRRNRKIVAVGLVIGAAYVLKHSQGASIEITTTK